MATVDREERNNKESQKPKVETSKGKGAKERGQTSPSDARMRRRTTRNEAEAL